MAQGGDRKSEEFSNGQNVHLKSRREIKDGTAGGSRRSNGRISTAGKLARKLSGRVLCDGAGCKGARRRTVPDLQRMGTAQRRLCPAGCGIFWRYGRKRI